MNGKRDLPLHLMVLTILYGCGGGHDDTPGEVAHDLTTPEGAVLCLEDAYRKQDLEAAIECKDFLVEAKLMLQGVGQDLSGDDELAGKTAEVLELAFRTEIEQKGFPDFRGVTSTFSEKQTFQGRADMVQLTELCRSQEGRTTKHHLVVAKTAGGWKVISVPRP